MASYAEKIRRLKQQIAFFKRQEAELKRIMCSPDGVMDLVRDRTEAYNSVVTRVWSENAASLGKAIRNEMDGTDVFPGIINILSAAGVDKKLIDSAVDFAEYDELTEFRKVIVPGTIVSLLARKFLTTYWVPGRDVPFTVPGLRFNLDEVAAEVVPMLVLSDTMAVYRTKDGEWAESSFPKSGNYKEFGYTDMEHIPEFLSDIPFIAHRITP